MPKKQIPESEEKAEQPRCARGHLKCSDGVNCGKNQGHPTLWKPEYNDEIIQFFDRKRFKVVTDDHLKPFVLAEAPPLFEDFAPKIGVCMDTMNEWKKPENVLKYPGFSESYAIANELQKSFLVTCGVVNAGSASFIQFMLKNNHGMRDKSEQEISGPDGGALKFNIMTYGSGDLLSSQLAAGTASVTHLPKSSALQGDGLASQGPQDDASDQRAPTVGGDSDGDVLVCRALLESSKEDCVGGSADAPEILPAGDLGQSE